MKRTAKNATLTDIARKMGISPTAVSMALRNADGVSEELRQRVLHTAGEMNYSPALAARMLRGKSTGQLGLYLSADHPEALDTSNGFYTPAMIYFVDLCERNRYSYHIELSGNKAAAFTPPRQFTGRLSDGALMVGRQRPELYAWLEENPGYHWVSIAEKSRYCVLSHNESGIYRAVEYLAALGHRRLAFAHANLEYEVHAAALRGYRQAATDFGLEHEAGLVAEINGTGRGDFTEINAWADFLLDPVRRPSAVICNDQKLAHALMFRAAYRGLTIPNDLSIIAYGTRSGAERIYPCTTLVEADFPLIIEKGIAMLLQLIRGEEVAEPTVLVEPRLIKLDSVASAPTTP